MNNAMQLKAFIKNISKEKNISAQIVLQNYMLERLLERISLSKYKSNFILKGGFLLAAMVGLDTRATMDMDATIKGLPVNIETISQMINDICSIELNDDIDFILKGITDIRDEDEYSGFRVSLTANYAPMTVPLKIDITTGDKITPREEALISTSAKRGTISIMKSYKDILETILNSTIMNDQWKRYQRDFEYSKDIAFKSVCESVNKLMQVVTDN